MTCPDTVAHDWVTATVVDHSANTTKTILTKKCVTNTAFVKASTTIKTLTGHNVTLTLTSHDDNVATNPSYSFFDDINPTWSRCLEGDSTAGGAARPSGRPRRNLESQRSSGRRFPRTGPVAGAIEARYRTRGPDWSCVQSSRSRCGECSAGSGSA